MNFNFKSFRGDTLAIDLAVTLGGTAFDLTGSTLFFTLKRKITDLDADALVQCQTGDRLTHTNAAGGLATLRLPAADTAPMPLNIPLVADIQVKTAAGEIYTVASGKITFSADVTLRTT